MGVAETGGIIVSSDVATKSSLQELIVLLVVVLLLTLSLFFLFFCYVSFVVAPELRLLLGRPLAVAFGLEPLLYYLDLLLSSSFRLFLLDLVKYDCSPFALSLIVISICHHLIDSS